MKTCNAFAKLTICVLSSLIIAIFVNVHKVDAESITDCQNLVIGTYLTSSSGDFGSFSSITTFTQDGNFFANASNQSGDPSLSVQPYSEVQGSWKCTSNREITGTVLSFSYPTATLPGTINKSDIRATFDPKNGIEQGTITIKSFGLNANPFSDDAPVRGTFTLTGQRVKP